MRIDQIAIRGMPRFAGRLLGPILDLANFMSKAVAELDERELLALAISLEEEDSRIYCHFRERLKKEHPEVAEIIQPIYEEEISQQVRLTEL